MTTDTEISASGILMNEPKNHSLREPLLHCTSRVLQDKLNQSMPKGKVRSWYWKRVLQGDLLQQLDNE